MYLVVKILWIVIQLTTNVFYTKQKCKNDHKTFIFYFFHFILLSIIKLRCIKYKKVTHDNSKPCQTITIFFLNIFHDNLTLQGALKD